MGIGMCVFSFVFIKNVFFASEASFYNNNWGISLPEDMSVKYKYVDNDSFFGDGIRFVQFDDVDRDIHIIYNKNKSIDMEAIINNETKSVENKIDFEKKYQWKQYSKDDDYLYLIYFDDLRELFVVQLTY